MAVAKGCVHDELCRHTQSSKTEPGFGGGDRVAMSLIPEAEQLLMVRLLPLAIAVCKGRYI